MTQEKLSFFQFVEIIDSLADLHEWENKNFPLLSSLTGRILYYRIAQRAINENKKYSQTMKDLAIDSGFTERSLRNRISLMEEEGFVVSSVNETDGRSKYPIPNEKFFAAMYLHARQAKRILEKDFLLIKK